MLVSGVRIEADTVKMKDYHSSKAEIKTKTKSTLELVALYRNGDEEPKVLCDKRL